MKEKYAPGNWILVPLDKGGFALGFIARASSRGTLLCYFFGPRLQTPPALESVVGLKALDAVKVVRVGDLRLLNGKWPILGSSPLWNVEDWPMPPFVRRCEITKMAWRVEYSQKDLVTPLREAPEPFTSRLERDAIFGARAAEIMLDAVIE